MKKNEKKDIVSGIKKKMESLTVAVLADYKSMTVKEVTDLKRRLRAEGAEFIVAKNTLAKLAVVSEELKAFKDLLSGPTAIIIGTKDPVNPIKILAKFVSETEKPKIKGGIFDGRYATAQEISAISKLPGRQELIAKAVGGIKSPLFGLVFVLSGNLRKLVYALQAIKEKKGQA